jgi:hypothetical protein
MRNALLFFKLLYVMCVRLYSDGRSGYHDQDVFFCRRFAKKLTGQPGEVKIIGKSETDVSFGTEGLSACGTPSFMYGTPGTHALLHLI